MRPFSSARSTRSAAVAPYTASAEPKHSIRCAAPLGPSAGTNDMAMSCMVICRAGFPICFRDRISYSHAAACVLLPRVRAVTLSPVRCGSVRSPSCFSRQCVGGYVRRRVPCARPSSLRRGYSFFRRLAADLHGCDACLSVGACLRCQAVRSSKGNIFSEKEPKICRSFGGYIIFCIFAGRTSLKCAR